MARYARLLAASALVAAGALTAAPVVPAAADTDSICNNIHVWNSSSTEYVRLKRDNGTTRDLLPLTETSGSYRQVQVPATDDVQVTEYASGGPTTVYTSTGWHAVSAWNCSGWDGYAIRVH